MVVFNLSEAFLHAKYEDKQKVIKVIEGHLAELVVMTEPNVHRKYVIINRIG